MMKIDENYSVLKDKDNFILCFEQDKGINEKTGKRTIYKSKTFHMSMEQALQSYLSKQIVPSKTVGDLLDGISDIKDTISNFCKSQKS